VLVQGQQCIAPAGIRFGVIAVYFDRAIEQCNGSLQAAFGAFIPKMVAALQVKLVGRNAFTRAELPLDVGTP
jgi:hypothetical protein